MKLSYKIALAASLLLFIVVVLLSVNSSDQPGVDTPSADAAQTSDTHARPTLKDGSDDAAQVSDLTKASAPTTTKKTETSLAEDVRRHFKAVNDAGHTADGNTNKLADSGNPKATENAPPGAIALSRTDESTTTTTPPGPKPTPVVSQQMLDNILGGPSGAEAKKTLTIQTPGTTATDTSANGKTTPTTNPAFAGAKTVSFKGGTYLVQPRDTFSSIAVKTYGDESKWFDIAQANPTVDPTRLRVGQELKLPAIETLLVHNEPVPDGPDGVKSYTIRPGDSLSTVANKFYGDPTLWRTIFNFNRDKIGNNPNAIQAGMNLKVPPLVEGAR